MNPIVLEFAKARVRGSERLRLKVYTDTTGNPTIGWGHKLLPDETLTEIGSLCAERMLNVDFDKHVAGALTHPCWSDDLAVGRQAALIDIAYNMGPDWWREFTITTEHMKNGRWDAAGDTLLVSKYANQVRQRAVDNATMLRTGEFCWT